MAILITPSMINATNTTQPTNATGTVDTSPDLHLYLLNILISLSIVGSALSSFAIFAITNVDHVQNNAQLRYVTNLNIAELLYHFINILVALECIISVPELSAVTQRMIFITLDTVSSAFLLRLISLLMWCILINRFQEVYYRLKFPLHCCLQSSCLICILLWVFSISVGAVVLTLYYIIDYDYLQLPFSTAILAIDGLLIIVSLLILVYLVRMYKKFKSAKKRLPPFLTKQENPRGATSLAADSIQSVIQQKAVKTLKSSLLNFKRSRFWLAFLLIINYFVLAAVPQFLLILPRILCCIDVISDVETIARLSCCLCFILHALTSAFVYSPIRKGLYKWFSNTCCGRCIWSAEERMYTSENARDLWFHQI